MWKKPAQVTDLLAKIILHQVKTSRLLDMEVDAEGDDFVSLLMQWLKDMIEMGRTSPSDLVFASPPWVLAR